MSWKPDERTRHHHPDTGVMVVSERDSDGTTSHLVTFPGDVYVRVLPDERTSGHMRAKVISSALNEDQKAGGLPAYLIGRLELAGCKEWKVGMEGPALKDLIEDFIGGELRREFLKLLADNGYEIKEVTDENG